MSSEDERRAKVEAALERTQGQSTKEQAQEAVQYLMTDPSQRTTDEVWAWLVKGLVIMIGVALLGLIGLIAAGKSTEVVLTAFTTMTSGLLGLFVRSPVQGGRG